MEDAKHRFTMILADEKREVEELKEIIKERSNLKGNITAIKDNLKDMENKLKSIDDKVKNRISKICQIDEEIRNLNFDVQCSNVDIMMQIIIDNLPDEFLTECNNEDENLNILKSINIYHTNKYETSLRKKKESSVYAGRITISSDNNQFKVNVALGKSDKDILKQEEFTTSNLNRIYKIIVWINTNLNYKE
ncbi:hypothetical protein [Clostridium felsineum]|uniref:hypothetical protein n=1 Tax=Clostridium felsineum TaxID=36839 RepID=UPI00098CE56E|nr:hypothetical protein [Clostridium felsineum]URZ17188.1 hypothetical protein CLFE_032400 [Clostridium felsineum DSM 794]